MDTGFRRYDGSLVPFFAQIAAVHVFSQDSENTEGNEFLWSNCDSRYQRK